MGILIICDSEPLRTALQALLPLGGFPEMHAAGSVGEASSLFGAAGTPAPPVDAVLLDADLQGGGAEACRELKRREAAREVPVLMLASLGGERQLEEMVGAGATDYVSKPIRLAELLLRLRAAVRRRAEGEALKAREGELLENARALRQSNEALRLLSMQDELTGIANRRFFNTLLLQEWRRAAREVFPLSLILIDIDGFKIYNDRHGHQQGDACLRQVAAALSGVTKRSGDQVARYGGEEFAVILPHTNTQGAAVVAEALRKSVEDLQVEGACDGQGTRVTVSLGVATQVPERTQAPDLLVLAADQALYDAKREGRNRVQVFSDRHDLSRLRLDEAHRVAPHG